MNIKKYALSLLFSSMVLSSSTYSLSSAQSSFKNSIKNIALVGAVTGTVVAAANAYAWYTCYKIEKELHGSSRKKHTWNFLEELFPSFYEMQNAENEFHMTVNTNVPSFRANYLTDPLFLVHFVEEAKKDKIRLTEMKDALVGNPESKIDSALKSALNKTVFYGMNGKIDAVYQEIIRYEKRLSYIINSIINSYEFNNQRTSIRDAKKK